MTQQHLLVGLNRTVCIDKAAEESLPLFNAVAIKALQRDKHTCRFCGFQAREGQKVVTANDVYTPDAFELSNMLTACPLCYACRRMGISVQKDAFQFIYCPDLPQYQLNHVQRLLYLFRHIEQYEHIVADWGENQLSWASHMSEHAEDVWQSFEARVHTLESYFPRTQLTDPKMVVEMLFEQTPEEYAKRERFFGATRILFSDAALKPIIDTYAETIYRNIEPVSLVEQSKHFLKSYMAGAA